MYTDDENRYGAARMGRINWRGASKSSGRIAVFLAMVRAGSDVVSGGRYFSYWETVAVETTGISWISHQSRGILLVGGRVSSTRY